MTMYYAQRINLLFLFTLANCYMEFESPHLYSPNKKNIIKLSNGSKSGLIVDQKRLGTHNLDRSVNFLCKFQVQAQHPFIHANRNGMFVVIQDLDLRKNELTGECIDYVQLEAQKNRSRKFCGKFNTNLIMGADSNKDNHITHNTFVDSYGKINVTIFINEKPPANIAFNMTFTVYKACEQASKSDTPCKPKDIHSRCINKDFIQDGYINCPYPECTDEGGCSTVMNNDSGAKIESVSNGVMIRSAHPLFVTFGIIICYIAGSGCLHGSVVSFY